MPKQVFACEYCNKVFSTHDEAVKHEYEHYKPCANPSCSNKVFVKDTESRLSKKYCSRRCGNVVKQQNFRVRKSIDFLLG